MARERFPDHLESDPSGGRERELEELFARCVDRLNRGEKIDAETILAENPDAGPELLEYLEGYIEAGAEKIEPPGLRKIGDYTLRRQIGRGGMGVVYEAWENSMDRRVALKVLPAGIAADTKAFTRFCQEAKLAGQLHHPNIVPVFGMGIKEDTPHFSMEFIEGETLAQIVTKFKDAPLEMKTPFGFPRDDVAYFSTLARTFADVADGLQHAHSHKIVHRDIKPSNLILDAEGRLRILDFGLARLEGQESLTVSGDLVGTPQYMSPEQARRRKIAVDYRTDIYSLGATLYEMLTLQPPFRGKDHADTLSQIIEREPVLPRKLNPRVPVELETIVLKCMRKEAGDRYGTAEALAQDLRRFVRGDAIEAQPQATWERVGRRLQRYRKALLAAVGVAAAIVVGLAVSTVLIANAYRSAEEHRVETQRELYIADMRLALSDWEAGNFGRFENLLERHRPRAGERDLRGWEWHHLDARRHTSLARFEIHPEAASAVAWSPGGQRIACGGSDGVIKVFDVTRRVQLFTRSCPVGPVRAVAWSPTGDRIAAVCQDGTLTGWDENGREVFSHAAKVNSVQFFAVAFSPNGSLLAYASADKTVRVSSSSDGAVLQTIELSEFRSIPCLSFSSNGERLAVACLAPGRVVVFETATWKEIDHFNPPAWLYTAVWSPNGSFLATSSADGTVTVWDASTWEEKRSFRAHAGYVLSVDWSPDGRQVVSGGQDGLVKVWNLEAQDTVPIVLRGHTGVIWSVGWNGKSDRIASASQDGTVRIWDPSSSTEFVAVPGSAPAAWDHEGRRLAVANVDGKEFQVRDAENGRVIGSVQTDHKVSVLAFSRDDRLLAGAADGDALRVWAWEDRAVVHTSDGKHGGELLCLSWAPDATQLATGGKDGVVRIWDVKSSALVDELRGHNDRMGSVAWSPDGSSIATTDIAFEVKIWSRTSGGWRLLHDLRRGRKQWEDSRGGTWPCALAWSPDGRRLAAVVSSGVPEGLVVWNLSSGSELFRVQGHSSGVTSVAWSPDGGRLATGGADQAVIIWDAEKGEELIRLRGHARGIHLLSWDGSGRRLLSGDSKGELRVWDAPEYKPSRGE